MSELPDLDARGLSAAIAARQVSCAEVMTAFLDRIERINPDINAIISLRPRDVLMAEAKAADAAPRKGWLHGMPFAIKDLVETAGIRTTHGSPIYADHVPDADELLAARIRAAGAILIGKTNTPEFGLGSHTYNPVHGATLNPYDRSKTAGGSSGGAAAALAARLLPVADGSDTMGSLRNPAAYCNLYGFRPSFGRIARDRSADLFLHQISTDGGMARNVRDLAGLLDTLAGPDPRDPHALPRHPSFLDGLDAPSGKSVRIGWIGDWAGRYPMEQGVLALCAKALGEFERLGVGVEPMTPDFDAQRLWDAWVVLRYFAMAGGKRALYDAPAMRTQLKPELIYEIEGGLALSAIQVHQASVVRTEWYAYLARLFETYDVLALPSAQLFPFDVTLDWPKTVGGREMKTYHQWMEVMIPAAIAGLPTLSVPVGFSEQGLPMGMQLIGRRGADLAVLRIGEAYHQATDWPGRYPPRLEPSSVASAP
jgi:amidase